MKLEIDKVDFGFITNTLCRAAVVFEGLGRSHDVCAKNRDRYREYAEMALQARNMMYDAKHDAEKEGGAK